MQTYVPESQPVAAPSVVDVTDATKFVVQQENIVVPANVQEAYVPETTQQFTVKTCSNCGKTLAEGMLFCTECGQRV